MFFLLNVDCNKDLQHLYLKNPKNVPFTGVWIKADKRLNRKHRRHHLSSSTLCTCKYGDRKYMKMSPQGFNKTITLSVFISKHNFGNNDSVVFWRNPIIRQDSIIRIIARIAGYLMCTICNSKLNTSLKDDWYLTNNYPLCSLCRVVSCCYFECFLPDISLFLKCNNFLLSVINEMSSYQWNNTEVHYYKPSWCYWHLIRLKFIS